MAHVAKTRSICPILAALVSVLSSTFALAGPLLYVHDEYGTLATVNTSTGKVSKIGSMGVVMTDIASNSDGNLFGISYDDLYRIDRRTGDATWIGRHNIPGANALTFSPDGELFAAGSLSTKLYSINPLTGKATTRKELGYASAGDLAYANTGCSPFAICIRTDSLYMTSTRGDLISIADDRNRGQKIGSLGVSDMLGLTGGPNGELYGFAGNTLYAIDTWNGSAYALSSLARQGLGEIYGATRVIPEPNSILLAVFAGFATLACFPARRR